MPFPKFSRLVTGISLLAAVTVLTVPLVSSAAPRSDNNVLTDVGGYRVNSVLIPAGRQADLPPIVFIHGASGSLLDPMYSFRKQLEGRAKLLFVDRPGHGLSDSGGDKATYPDEQADAIARVMDSRGIAKAIIVGHSFGGSVTAAFAVRHPDKVIGLVFLSPAVYPWPGGVAWYYHAASAPVVGWLFSGLIVPPLGLVAIDRAVEAVFSPNGPAPADYVSATKARQAIEPAAFRHNAQEIANLSQWAETASRRYRDIKAPTIIITGDTDEIVSPQVHSQHLARDIRGARLIMVHNLGHKSDYIARDLAVASIEVIAGKARNLEAIKDRLEKRIAADKPD